MVTLLDLLIHQINVAPPLLIRNLWPIESAITIWQDLCERQLCLLHHEWKEQLAVLVCNARRDSRADYKQLASLNPGHRL